jgi:DNA repair ATPase RecN
MSTTERFWEGHMQRFACVAALVLTVVALGRAEAALTGKWQGETGAGSSIVLDLAVKGASVTGTLVRDGKSSHLSEGKVSGTTFSFTATLNDRTEKFSGELVDNQIKIWLDRQGPSKAIVLTRVRT